jgi:sacsin
MFPFYLYQTVFRLPLRSASHVDHDTPISTALWSARDIQDKILPAFHGIARDCLLFTGLECIQAHIRTQEGILQPLWSFEAERGDMPETIDRGTFQCGMVTITEDQSQPQLWQTVSYVVPDDAIPEDLSSLDKAHGRRLKHPKVSLAAFIRPPGAGYLDYHQKGVFFSTLPLTEETGLPVHCSGTFITTSDRRHIRLQLENDTSLQSRYNEWLLKDVIPPAYLTLLEWLLINGVPNHHFWPVNARVPADRILIPSLYENHLRNTDKNLFEGRFSPHKYLKPDEVVILGEGSDIQNIIEFLSPPNVAVYAEPFLSCVTDDAQLPPVSPRFVRDQILFDAARFLSAFSPSPTGEQSQLSIDDLINLLDFFLDHDADQLVELPLLPLEDGSFGAFARDPSQSTSYIWKYQSVPYQMFANPRHLVKLDFNAGILLNKGFNVEELCSSSLASLIEELFPKQSSINVSEHPGAQEFIDHFWASYPVLRLDFEDMKEFPLVPTLSPGQYISLSVCKNGDISIVPGRVDESACQCLATLGIPLVQISSPRFPRPLSNILINHKFNMKDILKSLQQTDLQRLIDGFSHLLSDERRADFSDWIRRQLFLDVPPELLETARALPVWQGHDRAGLHLYVPASELVLFPESLDHNIVAPYTTQYKIAVIAQGQNDILRPTLERRLGVCSMSFRHLLRDISSGLPASMPEAATRLSYRQLVEAVVERGGNPQEALTELKLPDAFDFTLRPVGDFYSREESETLFRNAFPQHSLKFVSREFQHMEGRLGPLRRTQDLTMEIFAECVEHIANINNPEGGTVAFDVMNDRLPVILGNLGPDAHRWSLIEEVEFIPKMTEPLERWNTPVNVSGYIQPQFDDLVAPQVILRAEFAAVAWSQRVTPERNLSEGLVRAYMGLGRPTVAEVVSIFDVLVKSWT